VLNTREHILLTHRCLQLDARLREALQRAEEAEGQAASAEAKARAAAASVTAEVAARMAAAAANPGLWPVRELECVCARVRGVCVLKVAANPGRGKHAMLNDTTSYPEISNVFTLIRGTCAISTNVRHIFYVCAMLMYQDPAKDEISRLGQRVEALKVAAATAEAKLAEQAAAIQQLQQQQVVRDRQPVIGHAQQLSVRRAASQAAGRN
jgi:hypothetical protein